MNFKEVGRAALLVSLLGVGSVQAEDFIRLVRPQSFRVEEGELILHGKVDTLALRRLEVRVEPFVGEGGVRRYEWDVLERTFQGKVTLFPGLNLVTLASPGGRMASQHVFFSAAAGGGSEKPWGTESPVVFIEPRVLRVDDPRVRVEGMVGRPGVKAIYLLSLTQDHLAAMKGGPNEQGAKDLTFLKVPVKELRFGVTVPLGIGDNILLARSADTPGSYEETALRSIIWEPKSPRLSLTEPRWEGTRVVVGGQVVGAGPVRVQVTALVRKGPKNYWVRHVFWDGAVVVGNDGRFETRISLELDGSTADIRDFPIIEARRNKDHAAKVFLNWKER